MKLPNDDKAIVPDAKITDYLLSENHRDGRHKAAFFRLFGYRRSAWRRLQDDLLKQASHDVIAIESSPFGMRYVIEGIIHTPGGREPRIRTVWFIEHDLDIARLVTAYPAKQRP
jgi:hypothetical protein